ncbi:hypothetical protein JG687_00018097 [Phytophthora cactorum]|uniref:Uncharacterized protein n=1 Tax=Phytophthora cactorum TaxID=29920 RepID=A0A8T1TNM8_9STRA|nr:hypothetical protein JG687_00018097 [Phytophthora cactorum]
MDKSDESLKQRGIGGVNPLYARMADDSTKRSVIESTLPFEKGNKFVLKCGEDGQRVLWRACVKTRENSPACSATRRHEQLWPTYFAIFRVFGLRLPGPNCVTGVHPVPALSVHVLIKQRRVLPQHRC